MGAPAGPGDVLALIRRGSMTRATIAESTGLSRVTVAQRVDLLVKAGWVREAGTGRSTGGRRPIELVFDDRNSYLLTACVETMHTRLAAVDLSGGMIAEHEIEADIRDGPETVLDRIETEFADLRARVGDDTELAGVGIAIPAPVDPHTGRPSEPPMMQGWDAYPITEHLTGSLPVTVAVENDANAMALGERAVTAPDSASLCLVKVSTGIGSGIVIGGTIYRGSDGGAGDIGHVRLHGYDDALCQCGSRGCLAAVASGRAVARALTAQGVPATSGRDIKALLAAGDVTAVRLTREAGRRIGEVVAALVCVLNPSVLIVSGDLASNPLLSGIRETLYPRSLPRATRNLDIRIGGLGQDAARMGLTKVLVDKAFGVETVNARLAP